MNLTALIICVNYSDILKLTLKYNRNILKNIVIVTSKTDYDTINLCEEYDIDVVVSMSYLEGGSFNKGRMLNAGLQYIYNTYGGWVLVLDADMVLDKTFEIDLDNLNHNFLYGCSRFFIHKPEDVIHYINDHQYIDINKIKLEVNDPYNVSCDIGFFQLFHSNHKKFYPVHYPHADGCDIEFQNQFIVKHLSLMALHLGEPCKNWRGK